MFPMHDISMSIRTIHLLQAQIFNANECFSPMEVVNPKYVPQIFPKFLMFVVQYAAPLAIQSCRLN